MILYLEFFNGEANVQVPIGQGLGIEDYQPGISEDEETSDTIKLAHEQFDDEPMLANLHEAIRIANTRTGFGNERKVWLYCSFTDDWENLWRSEIVGGSLTNATENWKRTGIRRLKEGTLTLKRKNWWDGPEEQLPLNNPNGTNELGWLPIGNPWDGTLYVETYTNYVTINKEAFVTELPAPVRIEIANDEAAATEVIREIFIGHAAHRLDDLMLALEMEDAVIYNLVDTPSASALASGGFAVTMPIPVATPNPIDFAYWEMDATDLAAYAGKLFKPLINFFNINSLVDNATDLQYQFRLYFPAPDAYTGEATIYKSPIMAIDNSMSNEIREFEALSLPPDIPYSANMPTLRFELACLNTTGGAVTIVIDYVYLMPAEHYRYVNAYNFGIGNILVDDAMEDLTYTKTDAGASVILCPANYGQRVHLLPKRDNRIYFLCRRSQDANSDTENSVKVWYRPRKQNI